MRKEILVAFSLISSCITHAQIPPGYYNNAYNGANPKTCAALKTALFQIVSTDTINIPYNSQNSIQFDSRAAVNKLDLHRNDANTADIIWDMYTDNPTGPEVVEFIPVVNQCGSTVQPDVGFCYNREHSFPMSWFGGQIHPMRTDMHALFATDAWSNARHDNYPYAEVGAVQWLSPAGAKLGISSFPGYSGIVFEPIDAYKGDFARAMFYMVTCYENFMPSWVNNGIADSVLNGTTWPSLENWAIKQWYKWHIQDPVSQKEIDRNDSIYTFQRNRNPFIDHPEYVALIWNCTGLLPVTLTGFSAMPGTREVELKWNVAAEHQLRSYVIERSTDGRLFAEVGVVPAANLSQYGFTDLWAVLNTRVYYRLKMVDMDGRFTYSKTVAIQPRSERGGLVIYPNPANQELSLMAAGLKSGVAQLTITDLAGRKLIDKYTTVNQGKITADLRALPNGRYMATVVQNGELSNGSFVISR